MFFLDTLDIGVDPLKKSFFVTRSLLLAGSLTLVSALGLETLPVSAHSLAHKSKGDKSASYLVFDSNGSNPVSENSPCQKTKGCPNGLLLSWPEGSCVRGGTGASDRYPPITGLFMQKAKVAANYGPVVANCSTGIKLTWNNSNALTVAGFQGSNGTLAYIPHHVNNFRLFFQSGDGVISGKWLRNGKGAGAIAASTLFDDVSWFGSSPSSIGFAKASAGDSTAVRPNAGSDPNVVYFWRQGAGHGTSKVSAPGGVNDVDLSWYWNKAQSGPTRGCVQFGSQAWTSPIMPIVYTSGGRPDARVGVLTCPVVNGAPVRYDGIDASWDSSGNLTNVLPTLNGSYDSGVSTSAIPQPPAGTNGFIFGYHHDNYSRSQWTQNDSLTGSVISVHQFTKAVTWSGR